MHESIFHWVVILAIVLILWFFGKEIREALRHLGEGPRGGPPTHPVPVTGPPETSRHRSTADESPKL
jgi:hypothetical protein